jgi:beta-glucuronidase
MPAVGRRTALLVTCGLLAVVAVRASAGGGGSGPTRAPGAAARSLAPGTQALDPPAPVALATGWRYRPDPGNIGLHEHWERPSGLAWTSVAIPDDFNSTVSDSSYRPTVGWYKVSFTGPPVSPGRSWSVAFEGVRRNAQVWLNGIEIGASSDPYAPFSLPASSLRSGAANVLVVRADTFKGPGTLPEDWWNWGGITGPVTLQPVGRISLADLGVMPELGCEYRCADLLVRGALRSHAGGPRHPEIVVTITSPSGATSTIAHASAAPAFGDASPVSFRVPVPGPPALWSPARPSLYRVQVRVVEEHHLEQVESLRVGLRSAQVRGGVLYLNGRRLWLHGTAIHEDLQGRGAALTDSDIETIVSELRSVGANVTRAHYLLSPRLLDALDQAGIMVWEQPPVDHADQVLASAEGRARALALLRSTILGDRNHPSVLVDSIGNELSPTPDSTPGTRTYLEQASALVRTLAPGVPVGLDTYCYPGFPAQRSYSGLDVLGVSDYFGWYAGFSGHSIADFAGLEPFLRLSHARYPQQALVVSEFGAESLFDGSATTKGSYEFQSRYLARTLGVLDRLPFMNGSIYWTLREFAVNPGWTGGAALPPGAARDGLHHKGLIAYDGTQKPAFALAERLFAQSPPWAR